MGCPQYNREVQMSRNRPAAAAPTVSTKALWVLALHQIGGFVFDPNYSDRGFLLCFISASSAGEPILHAWHLALWPTSFLCSLGHPPVILRQQGTE